MKLALVQITLAAALGLWAGAASADPHKDESRKGRWRGEYERSYRDLDGHERPRRERRAFKQEYDDGVCKVERKLERNGDYKEEVKCRGGGSYRRPSSYGYRY